jgi:hypothetical protein
MVSNERGSNPRLSVLDRYEISLGKDPRDGKEVMEFLERGEYVAVVADGNVHLYPGKK